LHLYFSPECKAERIIRTTNNIIRSLLFQASLPAQYWVEGLHTTTYLLNRLPTKTIQAICPYVALFGTIPSCDHFRVFGCACYPNITATAPHKLAPRSTKCVFLGYSSNHKGYRCLDLSTNRIIISRHVTFDEADFPFSVSPHLTNNLNFLDPESAHLSPSTGTLPSSAGTMASPLVSGSGCGSVADLAGPMPLTPVSASTPPALSLSSPNQDLVPSAPAPPLPLHVYTRRRQQTTSPTDLPAADASGASAVPIEPAPSPMSGLPPGAVPTPVVVNNHPMTTRAKAGFRVPAAFTTAAISPEPTSVRQGLADPLWRRAMEEEFQALVSNNTWELVPLPPGAHVITGKWHFRHKFHADSSLERYKARWVCREFTQRPGVDYDETFSPVVKPATVRTVLSIALSRDWPIHQLDVKNVFLHGTLSETVYCSQPAGFVDPAHPTYVCRLNKSLYGLKQAPRAWYSCFASHMKTLGFVEAKADTSLFIFHNGTETTYLLLYVDDIILTASSSALLQRVIAALQTTFPMKDLGPLHHFLGITVERRPAGLFLHQRTYVLDIIDRAGMTGCKPCSTPVDLQSKLAADSGPAVQDATQYRSLAGALQYLTFTRPDITYAVQHICLHMHDPRESHLTALKRIIRYLQGTADHGLLLPRSTSVSELVVYTDADWAGCPDTRRSTSGYAVFLGDNLVSWSSKRQKVVSRSSAEAEYRVVANGVAEACWLRQLLQELHSPLHRSVVYLSTNPVQHHQTKHVEIDLHFVRERVATGEVRVQHVPTTSQFADIFTKGLPSSVFLEFKSSLNICSD
jgi:hypothetical protein